MGVLWITGGLMWDIPHCEHTTAFLAMNLGSSDWILTIFKNQGLEKLVTANLKIFLNSGKPCANEGALDMIEISEAVELRRNE